MWPSDELDARLRQARLPLPDETDDSSVIEQAFLVANREVPVAEDVPADELVEAAQDAGGAYAAVVVSEARPEGPESPAPGTEAEVEVKGETEAEVEATVEIERSKDAGLASFWSLPETEAEHGAERAATEPLVQDADRVSIPSLPPVHAAAIRFRMSSVPLPPVEPARARAPHRHSHRPRAGPDDAPSAAPRVNKNRRSLATLTPLPVLPNLGSTKPQEQAPSTSALVVEALAEAEDIRSRHGSIDLLIESVERGGAPAQLVEDEHLDWAEPGSAPPQVVSDEHSDTDGQTSEASEAREDSKEHDASLHSVLTLRKPKKSSPDSPEGVLCDRLPSIFELLLMTFHNPRLALSSYYAACTHKFALLGKVTIGYWDAELLEDMHVQHLSDTYDEDPTDDDQRDMDLLMILGTTNSYIFQLLPGCVMLAKFGEAMAQVPVYADVEHINGLPPFWPRAGLLHRALRFLGKQDVSDEELEDQGYAVGEPSRLVPWLLVSYQYFLMMGLALEPHPWWLLALAMVDFPLSVLDTITAFTEMEHDLTWLEHAEVWALAKYGAFVNADE